MKKMSTARIGLRRAIAACAVLSLFILQSLVFTTSARLSHKPVGGVVATAGAVCGSLERDDSPGPGHHDHFHCLMKCCQTWRDGGAAPILVSWYGATDLLPALDRVVAPYALEERQLNRPSGWASSWSSRAPPRFL